MNPLIQCKTTILPLLVAGVLGCFALSSATQAAPSPTNVNVVNTPSVNVINTTASPVQVRDVDNPASQPFQAQVVVGFADGASTTGDITIATVPAGKRLVIEYLSVFSAMLPHQKVINTLIEQAEQGVHGQNYPFGSNADGTLDYWIGSQPIRFYAQPGPIQCFAERDSTVGANPNSVTFTIVGYLVNCPTCVP